MARCDRARPFASTRCLPTPRGRRDRTRSGRHLREACPAALCAVQSDTTLDIGDWVLTGTGFGAQGFALTDQVYFHPQWSNVWCGTPRAAWRHSCPTCTDGSAGSIDMGVDDPRLRGRWLHGVSTQIKARVMAVWSTIITFGLRSRLRAVFSLCVCLFESTVASDQAPTNGHRSPPQKGLL